MRNLSRLFNENKMKKKNLYIFIIIKKLWNTIKKKIINLYLLLLSLSSRLS